MLIAFNLPRIGSILATAVAGVPPGVVGGSIAIVGATVNPAPSELTVTDPIVE